MLARRASPYFSKLSLLSGSLEVRRPREKAGRKKMVGEREDSTTAPGKCCGAGWEVLVQVPGAWPVAATVPEAGADQGRYTGETSGRSWCIAEQVEDTTRGKLHAKLPGQVDMMGSVQPVSQLHSTKAFGQYLADSDNYSKPAFIKYILKPETN